MKKLSVKGLALAFGISWAIGMLLLGWMSAFGWGTKILELLSSLYIGFKPGFWGGIVGAAWGLIDGAIGGALVALIYNAVAGSKISGTGYTKNISLH